MKIHPNLLNWLSILLAVLALLVAVGFTLETALASPTAQLNLLWWTAEAGGVIKTSNGIYRLSGTAGQFDAASAASSGIYRLLPGFWPGGVPRYEIFLPLTKKN